MTQPVYVKAKVKKEQSNNNASNSIEELTLAHDYIEITTEPSLKHNDNHTTNLSITQQANAIDSFRTSSSFEEDKEEIRHLEREERGRKRMEEECNRVREQMNIVEEHEVK